MSGSDLSSSDRPLHRLTVLLPERGLDALVFDAEDRIVVRGGGRNGPGEGVAPGAEADSFTADLPRGLYVLRASRSGAFVDTPVRLDGPKTVTAEAPPLFSAATVPGARTTHEYYTYPAWELSQRPTAPERAWNGPAEARLLFFVRAPESAAFEGGDQLAGLYLLTPQGKILIDFNNEQVERHADGWSAYSAALSPGLLILLDAGGVREGAHWRQLPVPLWPGWQTQMFVMHAGRLLWEDMRIAAVPIHGLDSRSHRSPYDNHDEDVSAGLDVDAGLLALQNGADLAAPRLINAFLHSKFQNPVLGLLGAYLLLLRAQRGRAKAKFAGQRLPVQPGSNAAQADGTRDLIREVLENLSELLPQSGDVAALRLMAEPWLGPPEVHAVEQVPLFRQGAEALLTAAAIDPAWLPAGGLLDSVSDRLYADTVWTSWAPLPVAGLVAGSPPDWVEAAVVDAIVAAERCETPVSSEALVRSIGVSQRAVREAMDRLVARAAEPRGAASPRVMIRTSRILGSPTSRGLARTVGVEASDALLERIREQGDQFAAATPGPNIHRVYAELKKTLSEYADEKTGRISADTVLDDLLATQDPGTRRHLRLKIARGFGDLDLGLTGEQLDRLGTVRDLARLIQDRSVEK